uniref:Ral guanine nucleotide dissociation stimulator-like 1 n=1 Tax=Columba livia TaxID=8932 RepID=R7VMM6_COLLI
MAWGEPAQGLFLALQGHGCPHAGFQGCPQDSVPLADLGHNGQHATSTGAQCWHPSLPGTAEYLACLTLAQNPHGPERTKVFAQQPRLCRLSAEIGATVRHSPCAPLAAVPALPESPMEPASRETPERWLLLVWRPPLQREAASLKGLSASLPAAPRFRNQLLGKLLQCCGNTTGGTGGTAFEVTGVTESGHFSEHLSLDGSKGGDAIKDDTPEEEVSVACFCLSRGNEAAADTSITLAKSRKSGVKRSSLPFLALWVIAHSTPIKAQPKPALDGSSGDSTVSVVTATNTPAEPQTCSRWELWGQQGQRRHCHQHSRGASAQGGAWAQVSAQTACARLQTLPAPPGTCTSLWVLTRVLLAVEWRDLSSGKGVFCGQSSSA